MDQFSPLADQYSIDRPRDIGVRVRRDLPALASKFDFEVIDDPNATKKLNAIIEGHLRPGKYAVTEKEWKPVARALEPFVRQGNLRLLMNLGVANGPFLHRLNYREAITASLWLEGLVTAPQSAGMSDVANERLLLRPISEMAVAGKKGMGTAFGVGGPQLSRALPYTDLYAASIGLRSGPASRGNRLLSPALFAEGGPFTALSRIARKDIRARANFETGVDVRLAKRNVPARAEMIVKMLSANLSDRDVERLLSIANTNPTAFGQEFAADPAKASTRVLSILRDPSPEIDLNLPRAERRILADQIEAAVSAKPRKPTPPSETRFTTVARQAGQVTTEEALRELNNVASKTKGTSPALIKKLGKAPFILALAAIISSGLMASGQQESA